MIESGISDASTMELILSVALGIGLSAACGFRVFVPLLGVSIAALSGHLELADGFAWMGSWLALIAFATATVLEVFAYYIPWLDNLLDTITGPLALIAGTVATLSVIGDFSPLLRWTLALIGGGGIASLVQGGTTALRLGSTGVSGGISNPIVSTAELAGASTLTALAIFLPLLAAAIALIVSLYIGVRLRRKLLSGQEKSG